MMVFKVFKEYRVCRVVLVFKDLVDQLGHKELLALMELQEYRVCRVVLVFKELMAITVHKAYKDLVVLRVLKEYRED
jgi:hypothetical protein